MLLRLWSKGFRNLKETVLELDRGQSCFIFGKNNQGKTNFLESIYYLGNGGSPVEKVTENLIHFDFYDTLLGADFLSNDELNRVYVKYSRSGERQVQVNHESVQGKSGATPINVDFISSDILRVFQESAGRRRLELDRFCKRLFDDYSPVLKQLEKALLQKNMALKQRRSLSDINLFNQRIAELSELVVRFREQALGMITLELIDLSKEVFSNRTYPLHCYYQIYNGPKTKPEHYITWLVQLFESGYEKELSLGFSMAGAQRDDFKIELDGRDLVSFYSRGMNRTYAILLKLAQLIVVEKKNGGFPILLLDDTFSELDSDIKSSLISALEKRAQLFYVSTLKEDARLFKCVCVSEMKAGQLVHV